MLHALILLHEKCAFSFDIKISNKNGDFLISNCNLFHSLGAAQANAQSPSVIFVLCDGVCSKRVPLGTAQVEGVLMRIDL